MTENTKGYVLASDGLWDEMKARDVAMKFSENPSVNPQKFIDRLMVDALTHAAFTNNLSLDAMKAKKQGNQRRHLHDDITILYVKLDGQQ